MAIDEQARNNMTTFCTPMNLALVVNCRPYEFAALKSHEHVANNDVATICHCVFRAASRPACCFWREEACTGSRRYEACFIRG